MRLEKAFNIPHETMGETQTHEIFIGLESNQQSNWVLLLTPSEAIELGNFLIDTANTIPGDHRQLASSKTEQFEEILRDKTAFISPPTKTSSIVTEIYSSIWPDEEED